MGCAKLGRIPRCFLLAACAGAAFAAATPVAAQQASFTTFGTGCSLPGAPGPVIGNRGLPRVGTTFTVTYAGPNAIVPGIQLTDQPTLIAGAARIDAPVPPISDLQPAGCILYPSPDVVVPMPPDASGTRFVSEIGIPVPNDPALLGAVVFFQWATPHSQCFFADCGLRWIVFSMAARAVVGT